MKHKKLNIIIILLSLVCLFVYILCTDGIDNIVRVLTTVKVHWMLMSLLFMVIYWLLEADVLHILVKKFYSPQKFSSTLRTSMIGQLFNCLTPFASGGQPMQAYQMTRSGVPLGVSTCSLLVKFIVYQTVLTFYSAIILIFKWSSFSSEVSGFGYFVFIGFAINTIIMFALFCICFLRKFTIKLATGIVNLLAKLHIVKNRAARLAYIEHEVEGFYEGFQIIKANKSTVVKMSILSVIQITVYLSIPFLIYKAFGFGGVHPVDMIAAQSFVLMFSSFIPLPGGAGGAEFSFYTFFEMFFPKAFLSMSVLFWRLITFYFPIIVGLLFLFRIKRTQPDEKKKYQKETE